MDKDIKRGEIYLADLDPIKGHEQGGVRPVVIIQNDTGNKFSPTVIVCAVTSSSTKKNIPTHVTINTPDLPCSSVVLLEQIRTIDRSRLKSYIGKLSESDIKSIDKATLISLGIIGGI